MRVLLIALLAGAVYAQDAVDNVFSVWDADKDGTLTPEEVPDKGIFEKVDADKDGKITREEVAAFFKVKPEPAKKEAKKAPKKKVDAKKSEATAYVAPRTVKERVADFFRRYDKNKDKKVQRAEFAAATNEEWKKYDRSRDNALNEREVTKWVKDQLRDAKRRPNQNNFFDLFDMNRDKKVTKREYDGPGEFFRRYDHDKNKVITEAELNMGADAGMVRDGDEEFMGDGPTKMPKRGLLERYDADEDGKITLEELKNAESVMKRLDKNGDGVLTGPEVR